MIHLDDRVGAVGQEDVLVRADDTRGHDHEREYERSTSGDEWNTAPRRVRAHCLIGQIRHTRQRPRSRALGDEGDVVVPGDLLAARHACRRWPHDRAAQRHARGDDVQKTSERKAWSECDGCKSEGHVLIIGSLSP